MWKRILAAAAVMSVAACQTLTTDPPPPRPAAARVETPVAATVPPPPPPKPRPTARRMPATATPTAPATATEAPKPIVLIGLSQRELTTTLGQPQQRVDRNPGQTWVYRQGACAVEVLLLLDVVRNDLFAVDRKVSGTDGSARGEQICLQRIKGAHGS